LSVLAVGCDLPGKPNPADREQGKDFGALYATNCAGCHGVDGKLGPAPPLNDPVFLAVVPDAELLRVIREGRSVTPGQRSMMPAFARDKGGRLTAEQVKILAEGIKPRWAKAGPAPKGVPPYLPARARPGGADSEAAEKGRKVFARACAGCHGDHGQGGKKGDRSVGPIHDSAFLALVSDQALRRFAITGRPDLGMPAFDKGDGRPQDFSPLTPGEIDDLVALLASWRHEQGGPGGGN
jgi:mono/diheme cytochrome c family protein